MQRKEIQRGDLFYYDFGKREGSVQSGERPVMVIQADNFNANAPTIIVAAVTAVMKKKYLPSHIILGEDFGLKKPSMVLLEQIQTVNKDELTDYIGSVNDERLWKQINAALKKTFRFMDLQHRQKRRCSLLMPQVPERLYPRPELCCQAS